MKTRIFAFVLAAILALSIAACGKTETSPDPGAKTNAPQETTAKPDNKPDTQKPDKKPEAQKFVGISFPSTLVDRWPAEANYLKSGLEALGYKAEIQFADEDANTQFQQCDNFISQGVDLLVVCAVDTVSAAQIVDTAQKEGIPVFSYCRMIEKCKPEAFTAEDNDMVGTLQGKYIAENVKEGNIIVVGGSPQDSNGILYREKGLAAIKSKVDDGSYKIVGDQYCEGWDPKVALANVENALTQSGNQVAAVLCPNDGLAGGAVQALEAQGLAGKVIVTGGDGELAAAKRIMAGTQSMTVFKDSKLIAGTSVKAIDTFLKGGTPEYNGVVNNGTADIQAVLVDMKVVTKDNLKEILIDGGIYTEEQLTGK